MSQNAQIITTSFVQAIQELKANKLRTFLSLLGITIGIFCIISVLTVVDSLKNNIQQSMSTLGSDVLYIGRWPWTAEDGAEYKWWEYWRRPSMTEKELKAIQQRATGVQAATLCLTTADQSVKYLDDELKGISCYAVTENFDQIQNVEIEQGRYLAASELSGGNGVAVIGNAIYKELFPGGINAIGKSITFQGRKFVVIGVMKKTSQNMAGFDFDNGIIYPYAAAGMIMDVGSLNYDPSIMVKAARGVQLVDLKYELEGVLRSVRKVAPGTANDFALNQLSQIANQINLVFGVVDVVGIVIAIFSLLVGSFGVANIMFVTVKERTKFIGLKKAIGARPSVILKEFLMEAIVLCILGGLVGIFLVFLLSLIMTYGLSFPVTLSFKNFFIGITVSAGVGLLAGFIPARSASRLDPVVAIRTT